MTNFEMELEVLVLEYRLNNSESLESNYEAVLSNLNSGMNNLANNQHLTAGESQAILSELSYIGTSDSLGGDNDTYYNIDFNSVAERDLYEQQGFTNNIREAHLSALARLDSREINDELRNDVFEALENSNSVNSTHEDVRYVLSQLDL